MTGRERRTLPLVRSEFEPIEMRRIETRAGGVQGQDERQGWSV
jgi:hypothetical protein